jgi:hypothetical protein
MVVANDGNEYVPHPDGTLATIYHNPEKINYGHTVVWSQGLAPMNEPYLVTDCDIVVPDNKWLDVLIEAMNKYPTYNKFGLDLDTRHIPYSNPQRDEIIKHERKVIHRKEIGSATMIEAPVDTTMALYRAGYRDYGVWGTVGNTYYGVCKSMRTKYPYIAKHLTWEMTLDEVSGEEHQNYLRMVRKECTHWNK